VGSLQTANHHRDNYFHLSEASIVLCFTSLVHSTRSQCGRCAAMRIAEVKPGMCRVVGPCGRCAVGSCGTHPGEGVGVGAGIGVSDRIIINMLMPVQVNRFSHLRVLLVLTDCGVLAQSNLRH
jgi:hypothetical protein